MCRSGVTHLKVHKLKKSRNIYVNVWVKVFWIIPKFKIFRLSQPRNTKFEPCHEISNNVVCATSKGSDQPAQTDLSLCSSLEYFTTVKLPTEQNLEFLSLTGGCTVSSESTLVKMPHCWKSSVMAHLFSDYLKTVYHLSLKLLMFCKHNASFKSEFLKLRLFYLLLYNKRVIVLISVNTVYC